jgi:hypothetical protein
MYPHIGKAGTPHSKSVVPFHPKLAVPPDPGTLFDGIAALPPILKIALLARKEYNLIHPK